MASALTGAGRPGTVQRKIVFHRSMPAEPARDQKHREWLTTADLADELRVSVPTVKAWRARGEGPIYARIGRAIRYHRDAVATWIAGRTVAAAAVATV